MDINYTRNLVTLYINLRKFSFSDRIIDDWNDLPTFLIESSSYRVNI